MEFEKLLYKLFTKDALQYKKIFCYLRYKRIIIISQKNIIMTT